MAKPRKLPPLERHEHRLKSAQPHLRSGETITAVVSAAKKGARFAYLIYTSKQRLAVFYYSDGNVHFEPFHPEKVNLTIDTYFIFSTIQLTDDRGHTQRLTFIPNDELSIFLKKVEGLIPLTAFHRVERTTFRKIPGFRTGSWWLMSLGVVLYVIIIYLAYSIVTGFLFKHLRFVP